MSSDPDALLPVTDISVVSNLSVLRGLHFHISCSIVLASECLTPAFELTSAIFSAEWDFECVPTAH